MDNALEQKGRVRGRVEGYPLRVAQPATAENCRETTLGRYLLDAIGRNVLELQDHDIVVVTSKLVSIFEGRTFRLGDITPSLRTRVLARAFRKDPRKMELIRQEGRVGIVIPLDRVRRIPAMWAQLSHCTAAPETLARMYSEYSATFMVKVCGVFLDDAGIDASNTPDGSVSLLPGDPCASARRLRNEIRDIAGKDVAVIITDTAAVLGRMGGQDLALGYSGLDPLGRNSAGMDVFGNPKMGGLELVADPLAAIAGLLMGQTGEATPMCLIRGYRYEPERQEAAASIMNYPPSVLTRSTLWTILATTWYHLINMLTWPLGLFDRRRIPAPNNRHG